jgi:hypothetical protein
MTWRHQLVQPCSGIQRTMLRNPPLKLQPRAHARFFLYPLPSYLLHPPSAETLPRLGVRLPRLGVGLPRLGVRLPRLGVGLPRLGVGLG